MRPRLTFLRFHDERELVAVDAVLVDDEAARVGEGDRLAAEIEDLLGRILGDVARAGDARALALSVSPLVLSISSAK
jgi:hypothetical protein